MDKEIIWRARWVSLPDSKREPDKPVLDAEGNVLCVPAGRPQSGCGYRIRREVRIKKRVKKAEAAVTAHGVYSFWIDGKKVGKYELTPEHTYYPNQLLYQVYDVTELLPEGNHVFAVRMADGWFMGRIGFSGEDCQYGDELALLFQMLIIYEDGSEEIIGTDGQWQYEKSAQVSSDLFVGECFDGRKYEPEFYYPGYCSKKLKKVSEMTEGYDNLRRQKDCHIEVIENIPVCSLWQENECIIADFGTVLAGRVSMTFQGRKDQEIHILHSETLDSEGHFIKNICEPYKDQEDIYICAKRDTVTYHPEFTYHGFRYVKIAGLDRKDLKNITAEVIGSRMDRTGYFKCSDSRLNRLQKNIYRSQISNMISIPTDCPQREKAGWTGDAQVFAQTACFNQDNLQFMKRWLADMRALQKNDGQIPIIVPYIEGYRRVFEGIDCSAGWSDASIIVPWVLYQEYGDIKILSDNYDMMRRWIMYVYRTSRTSNPDNIGQCDKTRKEHLKYIWNTGFHFGDWLTPSVSIDLKNGTVNMMQSALETMDIVPTLFYYYSTSLMEIIAGILKNDKDEKFFSELKKRIRKAFEYEYIDENGNIKSRFQGIYVLALYFDILEEKERDKAADNLVKLIKENGDKMDTGFLSTPYILEVLCSIGEKELAYQLLLNEECPSWLYEISQGATAIWESWQAVLPDGRRSLLSMNHYAAGCVGTWMYRHLAGIQCAKEGYRKVIFSPDMRSPLTWAYGMHKSVNGRIICMWSRKGDNITMRIAVPKAIEALLNIEDLAGDTIVIINTDGKRTDSNYILKEQAKTYLKLDDGVYTLTARLNKK